MKEPIEKLDVIHMKPFPEGSVYDTIMVAHKLNEVIDVLNYWMSQGVAPIPDTKEQ